jgi:3-hydroxyacyl-[acyl-carrier-protein] dehydratase
MGNPAVNSMNIQQIMECLPHRYPFLLVDRVISCVANERIVALKNVTVNEPFFNGHFPYYKVMPGVLIVEALAQASAILTFTTHQQKANDRSVYYFVGIDNARFKRPVVPGDALMLHAEIKRYARGIWWFTTHAEVGEQLVAEADLMCTLREIDQNAQAAGTV